MLKYFLILQILFNLTTQECLAGCLRCNSRDECLFCDGTNNYILEGQSCKIIQLANCITINIAGNCLTCEQDYFLEQETYKCIKIEEANLIENCLVYQNANSCQICDADFQIQEGKCIKLEKAIEGCQVVDSSNNEQCLECSKDYILSLDKKSCIKITTIENCASYSVLECVDCLDGYIIDKNIYFEQLYRFSNEVEKYNVLQKLLNDQREFPDQGTYSLCRTIEVEHCKEYESYFQCKLCEEEYYLDNQKCVEYPKEKIDGCIEYQNGETCLTCEKGKYLESIKSCKNVPVIENCLIYKDKLVPDNLFCIECENTHYLDEKGECVPRTILSTFSACTKRHLNLDECISCTEGEQLTGDKQACLKAVANCFEYAESDKTSTDLVCIKCKPGMYYNNSLVKCEAGTTLNCKVYEDSKNECIQCENQYYLISKQCERHVDLQGCIEYHGTDSKTCQICDGKTVKFQLLNGCVKADVTIENCVKFSSTNACEICVLDYHPNSSGVCEKITEPLNCRELKTTDITQCIRCKETHFILDGKCVLPEDYFTTECEQNNIDGKILSEQVECNHCYPNSIPYDYKNNFVCISEDSIPSDQKITNCLKYTKETTNYTCVLCNNDFNLQNGSCVVNCSSVEAIKMIQGQKLSSLGVSTFNYYIIDKYRVCEVVSQSLTSENNGCDYLYPLYYSSTNDNNEFEYACGGCKNGYAKVIKENTIISTDDPKGQFPLGMSVLSAHPGVVCKISTAEVPQVTVNEVENCEYYKLQTSTPHDTYTCSRCKNGYHGIVNNENYIPTCVEMTTCFDKTVNIYDGIIFKKNEFKNLLTSWSAFFSCYSCTAPNHIPFVAISLASNTNKMPTLKPFTISEIMSDSITYTSHTSGVAGYSVNCYDITQKSSFGIVQDDNFKLPTNCALGVINVDSRVNAKTANMSVPVEHQIALFCVACKPGFRAVRFTSTAQTLFRTGLSECVPIGSSCQSSQWFNACSKCQTGHVYFYNSQTKMIEFDNCVSYSFDNCYAAELINTTYFCKYCKKGHSLNIDGICQLIEAPKCVSGNNNFKIKFDSDYDNEQIYIGLYLQSQGPGCLKCFGGYVGLLETNVNYVCTKSTYVEAGVYVPSTKLIENCKNYQVNTSFELICKICNAQFTPSTNGNCIAASVQPDCVYFEGAIICKKCKESYLVISGTCEKANIEHCILYEQGQTIQKQICLACKEGYFPNDDKCLEGFVLNCEEMSGEKTCNKCKNGFTKVVIKGPEDYCYPNSPNLNCSYLEESKFSQLKLNCQECSSNHALSLNTNDFNNTICMNFRHTNNCEEYDLHVNIEQSSFLCKKCEPNFYLKDFKCNQRENKIFNCVEKKINADQCSLCESGFYVSEDGISCLAYPQGIKGCVNYSNATTCLSCKEFMYLDKNSCVFIEEANRIQNCVFYQTDKICQTCESGFAVQDGNCIEAQAQNCKEYESKVSCLSCPEGYGFKEEEGIKNCVQKNVFKCQLSKDFYPFECQVCEKDFYPDKGTCHEVLSANTIKNCLLYSTATKCSKCSSDTTLSQDQLACVIDDIIKSILDPKCKQSRTTQPMCMACKKGYFMSQDGKCVPCTQSTIDDGCYNCNPLDQTKCIICAPGYFQNKDSECKKSNAEPSNNSDNGDGGDQEVESASFVEIMIVSLSVFVVLIQIQFQQ